MRLEQRDGDVRNKPFHSIRPHEAIHDAKKISTVLYPINHPKNFQNSSSSTSKSLKSSLGTYSPHFSFKVDSIIMDLYILSGLLGVSGCLAENYFA